MQPFRRVTWACPSFLLDMLASGGHSRRWCSAPEGQEISLGSPRGARPDASLFTQNPPHLLFSPSQTHDVTSAISGIRIPTTFQASVI